MPPKRKRLGRPPGSKNKKKDAIPGLKIIANDIPSTLDTTNVCITCCKSFDQQEYVNHIKVCIKNEEDKIGSENRKVCKTVQ